MLTQKNDNNEFRAKPDVNRGKKIEHLFYVFFFNPILYKRLPMFGKLHENNQ